MGKTEKEMEHRRISERFVIPIIRNIAGMVLITSAVVAIAIAAYALFDLHDVGTRAQPVVYEKYKPREDRLSFEELIKINPEVIGWIDIYGTNIDYPVVQGEDNKKYLQIGADLRYSLSGAIFLDSENQPDFSDFNNIIYGHSMSYNAMFGDISDFQEERFFRQHRYGDLYFNGQHHGLRVIGLAEIDAYKNGLVLPWIVTDEEKDAFLTELDKASMYAIDPEEKSRDYTYVLCYTCVSAITNGRHILICRLTDETYRDPFDNARPRSKDTVGGPRVRLQFFLTVMIILLAMICTVTVMRRSSSRSRMRGGRARAGSARRGNKRGRMSKEDILN